MFPSVEVLILEFANQFVIRTLMNLPKPTQYGDLLKIVNVKCLEQYRRYMRAAILLRNLYFFTGPNYIKELFLFAF